ncbi:hypothetical protein K458DRAFT_405700 [Lentithecium fluviatile CBS 122367]|uniref:C2H2-type domain-containing protein n=1 Tax=Lentithecium fluviatile CBS 122367 TaxID=1168545 RepID=A0A6G1IW04_9PLEO|nr:hypothetical protein K458DRAFT_405700 [Lentithecium fluviatile CBS 122367]
MSQPNNNYPPTFNFESFFDSQSSNASYQWTQQGSRPMGNLPSPSTSVRTTMTAPNLRTSNRTDMARQSSHQQESRIDPTLSNFSMLAVPPVGRPRSAMDNANPMDPVMSRVYGGMHDEPWSAVRMRNSSVATARPSYSQPGMTYGSYREQPQSDIDSIAPRSDSGYYTHPPQSVISNEPGRVNQELPSDMTFQVGNISVNSAPSEPTEVFPMQSDQASQYSGRSTTQSKTTYQCSKCKEVSKCPSDYKCVPRVSWKHMLKHDKPHVCDHPGCRRAISGKGFTTINDLQRHKKSVHRIGVQKDSYQCASENCRNRGKIWPRLDNFKQHISRMHKGEDEADLIRRSAYRESYPPSEEMSVAPMDTTLAGIGTDKQFPGNEIDDPTSGISLTPDQDSSQWTSFDPSSQGFDQDVDRSNASAHPQSFISNGSISGFAAQQSVSNSRSPSGVKFQQDSLNILADAASTQVSPARPGPPSCPQLSSAPQTKAEQQRQALQKFSKAIVGEIQSAPSADAVDLEDVVLRVLYGMTNQPRREATKESPSSSSPNQQPPRASPDISVSMTKSEALKASQAISNLIKQSGNLPGASRPRRSLKGDSSNKLKCDRCGALLSRSCDMKKHMKRHTKPYGCTYPKCHKRFGAKSDWKRHENSQHFQLESFRCNLSLTSSSTPASSTSQAHCTRFFQRHELFKEHLINDHRITSEDQIEHTVRKRRIGKNGQGQFWCGFCGPAGVGEIVRLKEKRNAAWDERFDHIDHHFSREKCPIEEWVCVEAGKRKGEVMRDMDKTNFEDEGDDGMDEPEEDGSPNHDEPPSATPMQAPSSAQPPQSTTKKRQIPMDEAIPAPAPRRRKRELNRFCCVCQLGPWPTHMYVDCMACSHHLCPNCLVDNGAVALEGGVLL